MDLLNEWLGELEDAQKVLDLGAGSGSFRYEWFPSDVIAVDLAASGSLRNRPVRVVLADAGYLPFVSGAFDLVICHHSLEHFQDLLRAVREIKRVLKPGGRLLISIPDGLSFTDRLYRFLFAGGGHFQQLSFYPTVEMIESETHLSLSAWRKLYSSFIYIRKTNFRLPPADSIPAPLPRRMRWLGVMPGWCFSAARFALNVTSRLADRHLKSHLSLYGWALAFDGIAVSPGEERAFVNVCMFCGLGARTSELAPLARMFYRCPGCGGLNPLFLRERV